MNKPENSSIVANCGLGMVETVVVILAVLMLAISIFSIGGLRELQRDKYRHALDAITANDICVELSRLVSDVGLGRDPERLATDWGATRRKLLDAIGNLSATAEADDKPRMLAAERALHAFVRAFERRMSMRPGDAASSKERDVLDASLDEQIGELSELLCDHESVLQNKADEADAAYESKFSAVSWSAAAVLLLVVLLVFRGVRESREIARYTRSVSSYLRG